MENMFGGKDGSNKIVKLAPLGIALIFVIISLATMPGTIGHKTKYVKKDDHNSELALKDLAVPVSLLSFTLLLLIIGIALHFGVVKEKLGMKEK